MLGSFNLIDTSTKKGMKLVLLFIRQLYLGFIFIKSLLGLVVVPNTFLVKNYFKHRIKF